MIGPIRRGMVRRHANTDTRFSIDNQPLLPRAASQRRNKGLIDESRQISARTAKTVMARGRDIGQYGRKKLGQRTGADEAETADENHERDTTGKVGDTE